MKIGYACINSILPGSGFKTCRKDNATNEKLTELIEINLNALEKLIDYNIDNDIHLFRIGSDLIPFGSSDVNTLIWWEIFENKFKSIGEKIKKSNMRVSMHPGQYTVINSPKKNVVNNSVDDLKYHCKVLDSLGVDSKNKLILHIGGAYGDKQEAIKRFKNTYLELPEKIKNRLVIENDDKLYNIKDVLEIGNALKIPVVFDNLHNKINPAEETKNDNYYINECKKTWGERDGNQKIHYSQQDESKRPGAHSKTIDAMEFTKYVNVVNANSLDIMLEVKDKNLSAEKCILCLDSRQKIEFLEIKWSLYKYKILENSPKIYNEIRSLLKDKNSYPAFKFFKFIDTALECESTTKAALTAAEHCWGYFKKIASVKEKEKFFKLLEDFSNNKKSSVPLKRHLYELSKKYNEQYLLKSYYFFM